ncbi:MAG: chromate transporter [Rikenellaceae bacterium]|nr:chromate transporter [Rikenellaceae bacterium]
MIYLELFLSFFKIGIFGFGGGYAMLSLIQSEVVTSHNWITSSEFADIVAISQMTPGPISINCATYIGYTASGGSILGATLATLGVCTPSLVLMLLGSFFYTRLNGNPYIKQVMRSMRPVIIGLIAAAALVLMNRENFIDYRSIIVFAAALTAVWFKANPLIVIALSGVAGYIIF